MRECGGLLKCLLGTVGWRFHGMTRILRCFAVFAADQRGMDRLEARLTHELQYWHNARKVPGP